MKILLISPWLPYPLNWGFAKRVFHVLDVLGRRHDVTLVAFSHGDDDADVKVLEAHCAAVHTVPAPTFALGKRVAQLTSLLSPKSFQRRLIHSPLMQQKLDELTAGEPFDIIHLETSQMECYRFDPRSVLVLDEHNIEYELYYRMYQSEGTAIRRWFNWLEYYKFKREETASWRASHGCVLTSQREASLLGEIVPAVPTAVVPNAVDTDYFAPSSIAVEPDTIVLTGLMKYRPNVDGALFFVNEIFPRILRQRPGATFYIVGGEAPPEVTRLAAQNVIVTGSVEDVRPYVHKAAVFAVPLRMGSGTRLKVLEGLSMGKPMVSTALGCEGIELVHGQHLLIADGAEAFAAAVLDLLSRPDLAQRLSDEGRALMLRQYRWEHAVDALEAFYRQLLPAANGTGAAGRA